MASNRKQQKRAAVQQEQTEQQAHDTRTLRALLALTDTALSFLSLETLLPELLERVQQVMQLDNIVILLLDEGAQELVVRAARGPEEAQVGAMRIPVGVGFAGRIAATHQPLVVEDLATYPAHNLLLREKPSSALGVPLMAGDRVLGVIHISSATPRQFTTDEVALLTQVADRIALAVERAQLYAAAEAARALAEQRATFLSGALAALDDGLALTNADGRLLYSNPAYSAMLGVALQESGASDGATGAAESLASSPVSSQVSSQVSLLMQRLDVRDAAGRELTADEWPQTRIARGETLSGDAPTYVRMRRVDGSEATLSVSGAPLRDDAGAIIGSVCLYRDITNALELSETLQRSVKDLAAANTQLRTLLEVTPVGVSIVDDNGKPQLVNDAVRQIWGQNLVMAESADQYGEYHAWRVDTGSPVAADEWGAARALRDGVVSVGQEYDIETFDGQRKTILDSAAPLRDDSGAITGAISVIYDITARLEYERRTRAALEAFIAITGALVEAPDDADTAPSADDTSPQREGAAVDEITHPQDGTPGAREESPLARRLAQLARSILGCSRVAVNAVDEMDGRLMDRPVAIVGMTSAMERQWWGEQLALQPHELGAGMLPADRERLIAGEAFTADLTRPPYQVPNDYGVTAVLAAAMRIQGRMVGLLALDFEGPANEPHVFTPEEVQIAEAVARLGAVVLVYDRLQREREAARSEALALTEANRRMDEFLGIASHELRTPITTVKANLQMAQRRAQQALAAQAQTLAGEPEETRTKTLEKGPLGQLSLLLGRAAQSAERQERLVEDLLDISRISAGRLEYRMESLDLAALTRETVEEQRLNNPQRRIELEASAAPVRVAADADRIRQAITNYLTNALKYSEADRPVVVALRMAEDVARVEVRDQGQGLTAEQQHRMFERFYRVPGIEVMSGTGVGLGLGLYITKTVIEQNGGQLGVESAPGVGSTFWFTLPLAPNSTPQTSE